VKFLKVRIYDIISYPFFSRDIGYDIISLFWPWYGIWYNILKKRICPMSAYLTLFSVHTWLWNTFMFHAWQWNTFLFHTRHCNTFLFYTWRVCHILTKIVKKYKIQIKMKPSGVWKHLQWLQIRKLQTNKGSYHVVVFLYITQNFV
jgi:hypothetical protein